ncbi:serine/threonine-protein kinase [Thalassoroseus pseudoceratinae]|uniref:serine/threonine-protein kinase n=1 Tax=Thalassoroseus pseudoceratinae TaxID=2713176 RepID=UPI001424A4CB|nr:serine/threonine-protein kinase [Thalassoroseus pseudoceratinae]
MPKPSSKPDSISPSCAQALREYRTRLAAGERIPIEDFLAEHPTIASELRAALKDFTKPSASAKRRPRRHERETHSTGPLESETGEQPPMPSAGQVNELSLPLEFGRYRIEKQLGRGAMGAVYLAHDKQLDRPVALKTPTLTTNKNGRQRIERFEREARAAARLNHEFICTIYDVGEIDKVNFIAMEFVDGKPLSELVGTPWPERRAVLMVRRLALAMDHAHAADVVHRDLKPANIMIDRQKRPKIMDFGLARQVDSDDEESRMTQEGAILGTPAYMSPEQVLGDLDTGPPADIYALGIILYELLTGNVPFRGGTTVVLGQILGAETPHLRQALAEIDPELDAICARAMAKKPEDRFRSMKEFAQQLTEFLQGKSTAGSQSNADPVAPPSELPPTLDFDTQTPPVASPPPLQFATDPPVTVSEPASAAVGGSSLFAVAPTPTRASAKKKDYSNAGLITLSLGFVSLVALLIGGAIFLSQSPAESVETEAVAADSPKSQRSTKKAKPVENQPPAEPEPENIEVVEAPETGESPTNDETNATVASTQSPSTSPPTSPAPITMGNRGTRGPTIINRPANRNRNGSGGFGQGGFAGAGSGGLVSPSNATEPAEPSKDEPEQTDNEPKKPRDLIEEKNQARISLNKTTDRRNFDDWYKLLEGQYSDAGGDPREGTYQFLLVNGQRYEADGLAEAAKFMATKIPVKNSSSRYRVWYQPAK